MASVAAATRAPGNAAASSRPNASASQPLIAGASSTRSSNGMPKVAAPTATSWLPFAVACSSSLAVAMPCAKLAAAPSSARLLTTADASLLPAGSHTAAAILVPPKSSPSTTGGWLIRVSSVL